MNTKTDDTAQIEEAVASAEIGSLIDAWRMRFGTQWVTFGKITGDAFFAVAFIRMLNEGHFEFDGFGCRLKERW